MTQSNKDVETLREKMDLQADRLILRTINSKLSRTNSLLAELVEELKKANDNK